MPPNKIATNEKQNREQVSAATSKSQCFVMAIGVAFEVFIGMRASLHADKIVHLQCCRTLSAKSL